MKYVFLHIYFIYVNIITLAQDVRYIAVVIDVCLKYVYINQQLKVLQQSARMYSVWVSVQLTISPNVSCGGFFWIHFCVSVCV